jgi:hypothetical protein
VANDPRLYREALAGALKIHHPELIIDLVEPSQLGSALRTLQPDLVIASTVWPALSQLSCSWLLLQPGQVGGAVLYTGVGDPSILEDVRLADIFHLVSSNGAVPRRGTVSATGSCQGGRPG